MVHGPMETAHGGVDLCPSTGGEENHPVHAVTAHEAAQCLGEVGCLHFCPSEGFDGRRAVIQSNDNDRPVPALPARPLGPIGHQLGVTTGIRFVTHFMFSHHVRPHLSRHYQRICERRGTHCS